MKPTKDLTQKQVRCGRATVSWGPRVWGEDRIIANAPADAWDDLIEAVAMAEKESKQ